MKFENPDWRFDSPGPLPQASFEDFYAWATGIARQDRDRRHDVLEAFKSQFSNGSFGRSTDADYAETDLHGLMQDAAKNAPLFIETFVNACIGLGEQGLEVPSVAAVNKKLWFYRTGYQIQGNVLIARTGFPKDQDNPRGVETLADPPADTPRSLWDPQPPARAARPVKPNIMNYGGGEGVPLEATTKTDYVVAFEPYAKGYGPPPKTNAAQAPRVFLCHSSGDKQAVRALYKRLEADGFSPWLDEEDLVGGQDWDAEIKKAVRSSYSVAVCLSPSSINRAGYVQKEIALALDVALEQPEGTIYIVPVRLELCEVPSRLSHLHYIDLFNDDGYEKLTKSLNKRRETLN